MGDYSKGKSEKEGLIPVTCKIIRSLGKKDEKLEYMNIPVTEISIVGFAYNYNEHETKIIVGLWDQTGYIEVTFFNKTESDSHFGLDGYLHKDRGVVKVIGKVKYYKDNIKIDGARIVNCSFNEFLYHKLEVISDWMYLTNEQNQEEDNHHLKQIGNKQNLGGNNVNNVLGSGKNNDQDEKIKQQILLYLDRRGQAMISEIASHVGRNDKEITLLLRRQYEDGLLSLDEGSGEVYKL